MPRIGCMYAGSSGSSHGCNKNSPGNGNGKWQGLAPITNMRSSLIPYTRARAGGENRDYVFCVNQLAGGVGRRSGQFVPGADGVKDCTPTNRIDPAVLEAVRILQDLAEENGLIFALRGVQETIHTDIDDLTGSFQSIDPFYDQAQENEEWVQGQMSVSIAISIINELKILAGVLSSADVQLHEATFISQLDADALIDKGFGFELKHKLGEYDKPVLIFGTRYTERTPILAVVAGGYADKCSDVPKPLTAANSYAVSPSIYEFPIISRDWNQGFYGQGLANGNPALTYLVTTKTAFFETWPAQYGNPFPWVNGNAKLNVASYAVMKMIADAEQVVPVTLTIAGTSIPLPTAHSTSAPTPITWDVLSFSNTTISDYRKIFDPSETAIMSGLYGYNKETSTFKSRVLGSSDDVTPDGVIVPRVFNYGSGLAGNYAFQNLSGLANETPLIFNVLVGYKISQNDDGHWVTEQENPITQPIGNLNC